MKSYLKLLGLPVLLAAALTGFVGCKTSDGSHGSRSEGRVLDDHMATSKVATALEEAPTYKFNDVKVSTYGGVVQLSGWVETEDQKTAAERIAQNTQGISRVINNISVVPQSENKTQTSQQSTPRATGGTTEQGTTTTEPPR